MAVRLIGYSVFCPSGDEELFIQDEDSLHTLDSLVCDVCGNQLRIEGITEYVK